MPSIDKLINAVTAGVPVSSVRFRHIPDEMHTVIKTKSGKVALQLGKTAIHAELWLAKQTKRLRGLSPNSSGSLGPISSANINSVDVYVRGTGWMPLTQLTAKGKLDQRRSPQKKKVATTLSKLEGQIENGRGPDEIASKYSHQSLLGLCKKWGVPTETISQKMDIATALIVEQWKRITSAA